MKPSGYVVRHGGGGSYLGQYDNSRTGRKVYSFVPWAYAWMFQSIAEAEAAKQSNKTAIASGAAIVPVYPSGAFGAPSEPPTGAQPLP